jgi:hypothetical protein
MTKKFHKLNEMMMDPLKVLFFTIYIKIKIRSLHHKTLKFLTNTEKLKINKKANKVCKKKKKNHMMIEVAPQNSVFIIYMEMKLEKTLVRKTKQTFRGTERKVKQT